MTATLTLTPLPPLPVRPADYDELVMENNAAVRAANGAMRGYLKGHVTRAQLQARHAEAREWQVLIAAWWETPEGKAYRAEVDAYELARQTRKAERAAGAQASVNRRQVAAVRSAACPRCFSTHAGEC